MTTPEAGFRKRTAVTWGLIALSASGAAVASALAYSDTAKTYSDDSAASGSPTDGVFQDSRTSPTTTTLPPPGFNGTPLAPGSNVHTRSRGS